MYIDTEYLGYGVGAVMAFWFFGLIIGVVLNIFRRISLFSILFFVSYFIFYRGTSWSDDFIQLPPGIDWSACFSDIVLLVTPLIVLFVGFGAYNIIKKAIGYVGAKR
jgi:hypothetical protein